MNYNTILITGGSGMIGSNIKYGIKPTSIDMNINNKESIDTYLNIIEKPSCIIHLAALNIRDCENNPSNGIKTNIDGTINMYNIAKKLDIPFVFISTGAVFSSKSSSCIFNENTITSPNSVYGYTKQSAENTIKEYNKSIIIRTGWLFGGQQKSHNKFVELCINNIITNNITKGSNDFYGSPTYVNDLIKQMEYLIINHKYGIHHIVNSEFASGYEIGIEIAKNLNKSINLIQSVSSINVPNSSPNRSNSESLISLYDTNIMRSWKDSIKEYIDIYILKCDNNNNNNNNNNICIYKNRQQCRLCNSYKLEHIFNLASTPPANHFVKIPVYQEKIPLTLSKCFNCNHIQLIEIIEPSYLYKDYLYISSVSNTMVTHLQDSVENFVNRFKVNRTDNILEIGANDGVCIEKLIDIGYINSIGIDPAENINRLHNLPIICDFFGSNILLHNKIKNKKFKLIYAFHCCAHIENIQDVFDTIYKLLDDDGIFIMEVGYFYNVVQQFNFDTIYHEHIDYHTCLAMNNFTKLHNMILFDISQNNIQSGSIQFYICKNNLLQHTISHNVNNTIEKEISNNIFNINYLHNWRTNITISANEINYILNALKYNGKIIVGYGASAKSTTFLHQCNITHDVLTYIIDDNILKQQYYSPGLHIPIKSRDYLLVERPNYIVILSFNFSDNIIKLLQQYINNGIRIIVPFPQFKIL